MGDVAGLADALQGRSPEQGRDGKEERQSGDGHPVKAPRQTGRHGRAGPGDAGDQRGTLDQTDGEGVLPGDVCLVALLGRVAVGVRYDTAPHHERGAHEPEAAQCRLDHVFEQQPDHTDG